MAYPNRNSGNVPYGDIVLVQTPTLDRWSQQLYAQQKIREAKQQQENQALDAQMSKEFSNIRGVDTPAVINAYNQYKTLKKGLLFNKDLQRDPMLYNQAQQAANEAFSNMNSLINQSREVKDMTKTMSQDRFKNPDAYSDDYGVRTATLMNTPVSELRNHPQFGDLTNWDDYRYKGANTNFNDIVSKVYGQPRKIVGKEEALDKQGIQFRAPVYEYGTPPAQLFEGLVNSLDHKTERDAAYKWKQLTPDVVQKIEQDYNAIPKEKWEQMGLPGPQPINLHAGSDAEKYMRLLSMQNAINTQPRLVNYENRTSEKAKMDFQLARDKQMEAIRHANARDLIEYKKKIDPNDSDMMNTWVDQYMNNLEAAAKQAGVYEYKDKTGKRDIEYNIPVDPTLGKALSYGGNEPDAIRLDKDGNYRRIFYKRYEKGDKLPNGKDAKEGDIIEENGKAAVDETLSRAKLSRQQVELALGKKALTPTALGKQMTNIISAPKNQNRSYSVNGKSYSHKQLNDMGYDDNEITEAIKAGIIK